MNYINSEKIFCSIDKEHQIKITIIDDIAWFSIVKLNYESYKTFLLLLKDVSNYFASNHIKYVKQYINKEDLHDYASSTWVELDDSIYAISTPLTNFLDELTKALGIKKI